MDFKKFQFILIYNFEIVFIILGSIQIGSGSIYEYSACTILKNEICTQKYIKFKIYSTYGDGTDDNIIDFNDNITIPEQFNMQLPMKLVIHGYGGKRDVGSPLIVSAFREKYKDDINIIALDWSKISDIPCYPAAVMNTQYASDCLSGLLTYLTLNYGLSPKDIHLIGLSLGAHIAGYAARTYETIIGEQIERITGLDPALPLFATLSLFEGWILTKNDAKFVDIIHTNAGLFGKIEPTGHVDFYVNGGTTQPFCDQYEAKRLCSHLMSGVYFAESIGSTRGFWGRQCGPSYFQAYFQINCDINQLVLMGQFVDKKSNGLVFVDTNEQPPFAKGKYPLFY